jgi:hypothetical protein
MFGYFELCGPDEFNHTPRTDCILCGEPLIDHPSGWVVLDPGIRASTELLAGISAWVVLELGAEPGTELIAGICDRCSLVPYASQADMMDAILQAIQRCGSPHIEAVEGTA